MNEKKILRPQKIGARGVCHEHEQSEDAVNLLFEAFPEDLTK